MFIGKTVLYAGGKTVALGAQVEEIEVVKLVCVGTGVAVVHAAVDIYRVEGFGKLNIGISCRADGSESFAF